MKSRKKAAPSGRNRSGFQYIRGMEKSVLKSNKKELFLCVDLTLVQETTVAGLLFSSLSSIAAAEIMITVVTMAATTAATIAATIITAAVITTAVTAAAIMIAAAHQCADNLKA